MNNRAMAVKLAQGECLDVRQFADYVRPGLFKVDLDCAQALANQKGLIGPAALFRDGEFDLCDAGAEAWVWSVGYAIGEDRMDPLVQRTVTRGDIYIAMDGRFYQAAGWECIWLR